VSVSLSQVQGLIFKSSQVAVQLARIARVRPPRSDPKKNPIFSSNREGLDGPLGDVVVDRKIAVAHILIESAPLIPGIIDCVADGSFGQ
jgi:hypothetical protein